MAHRRMRDEKYREAQWDGRWVPRIAPVNTLVDDLIASSGQAGFPMWRPTSPVIRPGCGGTAVRGEQVEERADPESFLGGVPEQVAGGSRSTGCGGRSGCG